MAVILSDNMAFCGSKKYVPAKIEDNFLDTSSIPIGQVQSSLFVIFLRPALSQKETFLLSDMKELCSFLNQLRPSFCRGYSPKECLILKEFRIMSERVLHMQKDYILELISAIVWRSYSISLREVMLFEEQRKCFTHSSRNTILFW